MTKRPRDVEGEPKKELRVLNPLPAPPISGFKAPTIQAMSVDATPKPKADPTAFQGGQPQENVDAYEERHVHEVYEHIADHFSSTRYKPWPCVKEFIDSLPTGAFMCDVGCGNGKNIGLGSEEQDLIEVGCDRSHNLLKCARDHRKAQVSRCDGLKLSFRSNSFDAAVSIAVIHHFTTDERRREAILEILRILRPGGRALIYVWAVEQKKDRGGTDVLIDWEIHTKFDDQNTVHRRYYHLFKAGELEGLIQSLAASPMAATALGLCTVEIEKSFFDKENWCVVLRKQQQQQEEQEENLKHSTPPLAASPTGA